MSCCYFSPGYCSKIRTGTGMKLRINCDRRVTYHPWKPLTRYINWSIWVIFHDKKSAVLRGANAFVVVVVSASLQEISSILLELKRVEKQLQGKDTRPKSNHTVRKQMWTSLKNRNTLEQAVGWVFLLWHHVSCLFAWGHEERKQQK